MDYPHPEELREGPERDEEPMCISVLLWKKSACDSCVGEILNFFHESIYIILIMNLNLYVLFYIAYLSI